MRHAPISTFTDARLTKAPRLAPARGWPAAALATLAAVLTLPRRVAAIRRDMALLGQMSAYELADIGLSRQDVQDAGALPLGHAPGSLLRGRADERRAAERAVGRAAWR